MFRIEQLAHIAAKHVDPTPCSARKESAHDCSPSHASFWCCSVRTREASANNRPQGNESPNPTTGRHFCIFPSLVKSQTGSPRSCNNNHHCFGFRFEIHSGIMQHRPALVGRPDLSGFNLKSLFPRNVIGSVRKIKRFNTISSVNIAYSQLLVTLLAPRAFPNTA